MAVSLSDYYRNNLPRCIIKSVVTCELSDFDRKRKKPAIICVTDKHWIHEFFEKESIFSYDFSSHISAQDIKYISQDYVLFQPDANIGDVSQTINASGSTSGIKRSRVHLSRFVANSRDKKYFYLVLLVDHLIVLNRINNNMKFHQNFNNVKSFRIHDFDKNGIASVKLKFNDGRCEKIEFNDDGRLPKCIMTSFQELNKPFRELVKRVNTLNVKRREQDAELRRLYEKIEARSKFGRNCDKETIIEEKIPLVKYGDIWKRRHNESVLIGFPIYNTCIISRRIICNIQLNLLCTTWPDLTYDYRLFDYQYDDFDVYKIDDLNDIELSYTDESNGKRKPNYLDEWTLNENFHLLPDRITMVVIRIRNTEFLTSFRHNMILMISYSMVSSTDLYQNNMGSIDLSTADMNRDEIYVNFDDNKGNNTIELVSIISSSENFRLTVEFNEPDHYNQFIEFLSSTLQFSGIWQTDYETELNSVVSAITSEAFGLEPQIDWNMETNGKSLNAKNSLRDRMRYNNFYKAKGFGGGSLIRCMIEEGSNIAHVKISTKNENDLLSLINSIHGEFPEQCRINLSDMKKSTLIKLYYAVKCEFKFVADYLDYIGTSSNVTEEDVIKFRKHRNLLELRTDIIVKELQT